jgi:hypothetical protein
LSSFNYGTVFELSGVSCGGKFIYVPVKFGAISLFAVNVLAGAVKLVVILNAGTGGGGIVEKSILLNPEEPDGTYGFEFENCVD